MNSVYGGRLADPGLLRAAQDTKKRLFEEETRDYDQLIQKLDDSIQQISSLEAEEKWFIGSMIMVAKQLIVQEVQRDAPADKKQHAMQILKDVLHLDDKLDEVIKGPPKKEEREPTLQGSARSYRKKFNKCVKAVRKTVKVRPGSNKESAAIAICTKSVLQTHGRTMKKYKKGRLYTQKKKTA